MKRRNFVKKSMIQPLASIIIISGLVSAQGLEGGCTGCDWDTDCKAALACCVQGGYNPTATDCTVEVSKCKLVDIKQGEPGFPGKKVETYLENTLIPANTPRPGKCVAPC
jgi:hypothetical protein